MGQRQSRQQGPGSGEGKKYFSDLPPKGHEDALEHANLMMRGVLARLEALENENKILKEEVQTLRQDVVAQDLKRGSPQSETSTAARSGTARYRQIASTTSATPRTIPIVNDGRICKVGSF